MDQQLADNILGSESAICHRQWSVIDCMLGKHHAVADC